MRRHREDDTTKEKDRGSVEGFVERGSEGYARRETVLLTSSWLSSLMVIPLFRPLR